MSLITNISQVRAASTISISNTLAAWQPYIDEAEATWIKPVIGESLFNALDEAANGSGSEETTYDDILALVRKTLALYALYLGIDEMAVSLSTSGIQVIQSESHKPASQYQIQNLKESLLSRAHRNMDILLEHIEANADDYPDYIAEDNDLFIHNAKEFQEHVDIRSSRRVFIALKPVMRTIEKRFIKAALSEEYYDELKALITGSGSEAISDDDQTILDKIKPAVAHLTMARALEEISIDILDWGAFDTATSTFDRIQSKQVANASRIGSMVELHKHEGEADMRELVEYLDTNAAEDKYATYFGSDKYVGSSEDAAARNEFENLEENGIFVV